jgi:hypothetical protein
MKQFYPPFEITERLERRFWKKVDRNPEGCWVWTASYGSKGYGQFMVDKRPRSANRVAYLLTHGEIPTQLLICHTCDNRACCRPSHLYPGTHLDNNGDTARRSQRAAIKLSPEKVREIRALRRQGKSLTVVAQLYGVDRSIIHDIDHCRIWRHVE